MSGFTLNEGHQIFWQESKIHGCSHAICFLSISFQLHVKLVVWSPQENGYSFTWGSYTWPGRALHSLPRSKEKVSSSHSCVSRTSPLLSSFLFHKPYLHSQALPQNQHFLSSLFWWKMFTIHHAFVTSSSKNFWVWAHVQHCQGELPRTLARVSLEFALVQPQQALGVQGCLSLSSSVTQYLPAACSAIFKQ